MGSHRHDWSRRRSIGNPPIDTGPSIESRPAFLITIDTEGDNLWSRPPRVTTRNAEYLSRFQILCEKYRLRPTYLTDWDMCESSPFREFGVDALGRNAAEIGMHLHPWSSPPLTQLTTDDHAHHPYLIEYPDALMRRKISMLRDRLEEAFGIAVISHRAGRWSLDERYARMLVDDGIRVDCSVTPHVTWKNVLGDPKGGGGTDYRAFPDEAYFVDLDDMKNRGNSSLLEIPVTIGLRGGVPGLQILRPILERVPLARRTLPRPTWLRPNGRNREAMLDLCRDARREGRDYVEFMLHSSEFMPAGSPRFQTEESIDRLYDDLEFLFSEVASSFIGITLREYHDRFVSHSAQVASIRA